MEIAPKRILIPPGPFKRDGTVVWAAFHALGMNIGQETSFFFIRHRSIKTHHACSFGFDLSDYTNNLFLGVPLERRSDFIFLGFAIAHVAASALTTETATVETIITNYQRGGLLLRMVVLYVLFGSDLQALLVLRWTRISSSLARDKSSCQVA